VAEPEIGRVFGVIVSFVVALSVVHAFAASLARRVELGRKLTWDEVSGFVEAESPFWLLCVFPVAILNVLFAFGVNLNRAIRVTLRVKGLTPG
jgi:uncharacterized protein YhhL (DUF1145 family)